MVAVVYFKTCQMAADEIFLVFIVQNFRRKYIKIFFIIIIISHVHRQETVESKVPKAFLC
jgi:hypothetical protein